MKLESVILQSGLTKKCPRCNVSWEARRIQVKWKKTREPKVVKFLDSDVMYCKTCKIGMMHSFFAKVTDQAGNSWSVEVTPSLNNNQVNRNNNKSNNKSNTIIRPVSSSVSLPTQRKIDKKSKKSSSKQVNNGQLVQVDDEDLRHMSPISHNGSPRSKPDSTHFTRDGLFRHGMSNRQLDNYFNKE